RSQRRLHLFRSLLAAVSVAIFLSRGSKEKTAQQSEPQQPLPNRLKFCAKLIIGRCPVTRIVFARSSISSPRPLRAALSVDTSKPVACFNVIVGGIESSCRCTTVSTSAGPSCQDV